MKKVQDQATTIQNTNVQYRAYMDPTGQEKPLLVVEGSNRGAPLDQNREAVAKELSARLGTTPDNVTYLEQAADGSLRETTFSKSHVQTITPGVYDLTPQEAERAVEQGDLPSIKIERYNMETQGVNRGSIEARLGEPLEPKEARQNREFSQMQGPQMNRDLELELER